MRYFESAILGLYCFVSELIRRILGYKKRSAKVYSCGINGHNIKVSKSEKWCPICNNFKIKRRLYFVKFESWL